MSSLDANIFRSRTVAGNNFWVDGYECFMSGHGVVVRSLCKVCVVEVSDGSCDFPGPEYCSLRSCIAKVMLNFIIPHKT